MLAYVLQTSAIAVPVVFNNKTQVSTFLKSPSLSNLDFVKTDKYANVGVSLLGSNLTGALAKAAGVGKSGLISEVTFRTIQKLLEGRQNEIPQMVVSVLASKILFEDINNQIIVQQIVVPFLFDKITQNKKS